VKNTEAPQAVLLNPRITVVDPIPIQRAHRRIFRCHHKLEGIEQ
jgi:hypothetical protein